MKNNIVIIKIGTKVITDHSINLNIRVVNMIARQISEIHARGFLPIIVSSGAVGAGLNYMGFERRSSNMSKLQAAAACGQGLLMYHYNKAFKRYNIKIAQVLLTQDDFNDRKRYLNLSNTLKALLSMKIIPIVNENDTVATDEIGLEDNDRLAGLVADFMQAEKIIAATDVDGVLDEKGFLIDQFNSPLTKLKTRKIDGMHVALDIPKYTEKSSISRVSKGGMGRKIYILNHLASLGIKGYIVNGRKKDTILKACLNEKIGTLFLGTKNDRLAAKKKWIKFASQIKGSINIDQGAKAAILKKKSLLATGVTGIEGHFRKGDVIGLSLGRSNRIFAKGLTEYSSDEIEKIMGKKTFEIKNLFGHKRSGTIVHIDNLVTVK